MTRVQVAGATPLSRRALAGLRTRALRKGVWFGVLNRLERASVDLTIRVVERVRSSTLAGVLVSIVEKLQMALESRVVRLMREVGFDVARKVSLIAQEWGHQSAARWKADLGFVQFWAVMHLNSSPMFGSS